ncbi:rifin PIR protein,putative [Plasmodium sp. DRC-Itaito]|nr:rifin PIR protein,putative [Plasmodium sp. DRC-Itaito]
MKVHYINILLFAVPLNILINDQRNHNNTILPTPTTRLLCECELYAPANYDNDPQMKKVMENFNRQTSQRFHEYDERMKTTRQKCKDRCDKEIQKIILKDKLEKELMDKFVTLDTDIQSDAVPTCVCEKSMADKVEKGCLRCAQNLGGIVAPSSGVIGEIAALAVNAWKDAAIATATTAAEKAGALAGLEAGHLAGTKAVIAGIKNWGVSTMGGKTLESYFTTTHYTDFPSITENILSQHHATCITSSSPDDILCLFTKKGNLSWHDVIGENVKTVIKSAENAADKASVAESAKVTTEITTEKTRVINTIYMGKQTAIIAPIIAIIVIILVMVIIYLILRYRRKKKMKKKLQYIKLLEE